MKKLHRFLLSTLAGIFLLTFSIVTAQAGTCELPYFDVANFSPQVDNPYLPLPDNMIGSTYIYVAEDEDGLIEDYIEFTTDTKEIMGVTCVVVHDVEYLWLEDEDRYVKLEETHDWHAWDNEGNFWYFGEDTTEYEYNDDWEKTGCNHDGAWEAGMDGALPGIILPADPKLGDCYQQEYAEDEAEDVGKILKLNAKAPVDIYSEEECMAMKEWTPLEPGNVEQKFYQPDVGLVYIKELKEKTVEVELFDINDSGVPELDLFYPTCSD